MTDDPSPMPAAGDIPDRMSAVNRGITVLILSFVAISLAASALPLWPDIEDWLPFDRFDREGAFGVYALALLGFSTLVFPLFVCAPNSRRSVLPWWWVGSFTLAFAAVPLFLLAWIAGVHRDGVIAILLWAGFLQGAVLILTRLMRYRFRLLIVMLGGLLAFALPLSDYFSDLLQSRAPTFDWTPFPRVAAIAFDFAPAKIMTAAVCYGVVQVLLWVSGRMGRNAYASSSRVAAALIFGLALVSVAAAPAEEIVSAAFESRLAALRPAPAVETTLPTAQFFVPGASYPVGLQLASGESAAQGAYRFDVAGRESWEIPAEALSRGRVWLYPRLLEVGETLALFDPQGAELKSWQPEQTAARILLVGDTLVSDLADDRILRVGAEELPDSYLGFESLSQVVFTEADWAALGEDRQASLRDWVGRGGVLAISGAKKDRTESYGAGLISANAGPYSAAVLGALGSSRTTVLEPTSANLYSNFALPDWGLVDLIPVLIFLLVYHLAFALVFLFPLCLDGKKSLVVYLISVGFVLALVVVGAHYALKTIFFTETQILQQSFEVLALRGEGDHGLLQRDEFACFASFNGEPGRLRFEAATAPRPIYENTQQGAGPVRWGEETLAFDQVRLDRFRRKQVFQISALEEAPFKVTRDPDQNQWTFSPRLGAADTAGFWVSEPVAAFARVEGRLHRAEFREGRLKIEPEPARGSWQGVLPESVRDENGVPFVRYALGRYAPPSSSVAVILFSDLRGIHEGEGYLLRRNLLQVLVLPLGP